MVVGFVHGTTQQARFDVKERGRSDGPSAGRVVTGFKVYDRTGQVSSEQVELAGVGCDAAGPLGMEEAVDGGERVDIACVRLDAGGKAG